MTLLSVIVLNYRQPELLRACLHSLEAALAGIDGEAELLVVDNGSGDGSGALVRAEFPRVMLTELAENRGFTGGVNVGLERSSGDFVALLNNDATIEPNALLELLRVVATADDIGSVAAQMRFADRPETINSAGIGVDRLGIVYDRLLGSPVSASERKPVEVFGASGGAVLWRRRVLDEIGALDDPYFIYLEDADAAWRARMRGWRALYAPDAVVWHHHSMTTLHTSDFKYELVGRNRVRLLARNACLGQLVRYAPAMFAYDLAYVAYAALHDRTLAPLRGRLRGLREWPSARRSGAAGRQRVELEPRRGLGAALARRRAWVGH
jgi:GT2 family glycosyltransferase